MTGDIWKEVDEYVRDHDLIREGDRVLAALSGGADSVCLLRYLLSRREADGVRVTALHVNHMLRGGEADRDEAFVRALCRDHNVPLTVVRRDAAAESRKLGCSVEEAGRLIRHECLEKAAGKEHCDRIAFAHHMNDQAETVLFRMIRGTGPGGMSGILPANGKKIRPLLCVDRNRIEEILRILNQEYVEDSTNSGLEYSRNRMRHRVIPELETINCGAVSHICELADDMRRQREYFEKLTEKLYGEYVTAKDAGLFVGSRCFSELGEYECSLLLMEVVRQAAGSRRDIGRIHEKLLKELASKEEGKELYLPYNICARKTGQGILIRRAEARDPEHDAGASRPDLELCPGKMHGEIVLEEEKIRVRYDVLPAGKAGYVKRDCTKYFACDRISQNLKIRSRRPGDYLVIDKVGSRKSLSRYFIDEKIPKDRRTERILLADGSHILWVFGGRISEYYKLGPDKENVLRVSISGTEDEITDTDIR